MPRGIYTRKPKEELVGAAERPEPPEWVSEEPKGFSTPRPSGSHVGRVVDRVMLHNGVQIPRTKGASLKVPASMSIEKGLFRSAADIPKPPNRQHADELYLTEQGVFCRYGAYEKLIPHANIYEIDFESAR